MKLEAVSLFHMWLCGRRPPEEGDQQKRGRDCRPAKLRILNQSAQTAPFVQTFTPARLCGRRTCATTDNFAGTRVPLFVEDVNCRDLAASRRNSLRSKR